MAISYLVQMKKEQGYDYLVKLLIIGNSGVGKTNLLVRFCDNHFINSHLSTIGIDFKTKILTLAGATVKLQIWDTAGQERFKTVTQTYYRGAMGIILTYAVDERQTFHDIENWVKQIKAHASSEVIKILVGNKSDSQKREVSYEEGRNLANQLGIRFYETSAKQDKNVAEMFLDIGGQALNVLESRNGGKGEVGKGGQMGSSRDLLGKGGGNEGKKKCC